MDTITPKGMAAEVNINCVKEDKNKNKVYSYKKYDYWNKHTLCT